VIIPKWVAGDHTKMGCWCSYQNGLLVITPKWVAGVHTKMGCW